LPKLEGSEIVDLGCGAGHFAQVCVEKGANKDVRVFRPKCLKQKKKKKSSKNQEYPLNYFRFNSY